MLLLANVFYWPLTMKRTALHISVSLAAISFLAPALQGAGGTVTEWGGGQTGFPAGLNSVTAISSSVDHSLALNTDGTVTAWGTDLDGDCEVPAGLSGVTAVASGDFFSLALLSNGAVGGWGADDQGQCAIPAGVNNVTMISAGHSHALAALANGTVMAWGWGAFGQTNVPSIVQNPKAIVAAGNHSMALLQNGTVVVWGVDDTGETSVPGGLTGVTAISGAKGYCLAVQNGTVTGWGAAPTIPPSLNNVVAVAAGLYHSLALTSSGTVVDWGANQDGEGAVPSGLSSVNAIAAGYAYSLALSGAGSIVSPVTLSNPTWNGNTFAVSFQSQNGVSYTLQYTRGFGPSSWTIVQTASGNGGSMTMTDSAASDPQRFYRVKSQ